MSVLEFFFFKQKTAYEMRIRDWSSDVCSSDLIAAWLDLMERCDALRKPDRFLELLAAASCAAKVDLAAWRARMAAIRAVDAGAIAKTLQGQPGRIKQAVHEARLAALMGLS